MRFAAAASNAELTSDACDAVLASLDITNPQLAVVFFTPHHAGAADTILQRLSRRLFPGTLIGCSVASVAAGDRVHEDQPGVAVFAGQLPGAGVSPFHIAGDDTHEAIEYDDGLRTIMGVNAKAGSRAAIVLADPFTSPLEEILPRYDVACAGVPIIGGVASAARRKGENVLLLNDKIIRDGLVGVSLSGPLAVRTLVSQGCRPIGQRTVITRAQHNMIDQLGGRPAMTFVRETLAALSDEDKIAVKGGLLFGRAYSEYSETFGRGDYLIRGIIGGDDTSGRLAVADLVRVGQTVQFHVRDAASASADLAAVATPGSPAKGVLLFTCNGRGRQFFGRADHDAAVLQSALGPVPLAGFMAAGEIATVGNRSFVHGHTATAAVFAE